MVKIFNPEERQKTLNNIIVYLQTDERIAGLVVVGSGSIGFTDQYSDVDLVVVTNTNDEVSATIARWKKRIGRLFNIAHSFETAYDSGDYFYLALLDNYLKLGVNFSSLSNLTAKRKPWRVAFDHTGKVEEIMQSTWSNHKQPDTKSEYLSVMHRVWRHVMNTVIALCRGQTWRTLHELEQVRYGAIELAGLYFREERAGSGSVFPHREKRLIKR